MENQEPVVFNKYLVSLTKIVSVYSFFFVLLKSIAIIRGAWMIPNIILAIPFIIMGILTAYTVIYKKYSWIITIITVALIIAVRYYEYDLVYFLQDKYGN
ncbi:hypothetical protein [Flavobacterium orientale]|uniref:Uncharacterized protein n=1 Tax=Flavobacterium orientale TaxID=1756020 RepID=A0A916Y0C4_9FLAO|nr:hypothetical protein [Flavobacterium orientale]GGD25374.1 hypothetical protein GCM10011343_14380 [Flavobacterium orientale]